jgi:serine/threonine protein kinase
MEGARIDSILVPQGSQGVLGHSNTAFVERVRCKRIMLARKRIRCVYPIKREEMIEEVAHLQRLSHAHVVRGVGTYVFKKELSILLYPATKYNLETFLDEYMELSADFYKSLSASQHVLSQMRAGLGKSIKCLVNTIAYIHENLVKHMDIKPTNILVQEKVRANEVDYKIYLADFGIARSYQTAAEVETDSATSFTRAYAAPEVFWQDIRGFPADIFSLGCVLIEIEAVLADKHDDLLAMRRRNRQGDLTYHANLFVLFSNGIPEGCCLNGLDILISEYWDALRAMLSLDPALRPTASNLQATFGTDMPCCSLGPEPFEAATPLAPNSRAMETLPE